MAERGMVHLYHGLVFLNLTFLNRYKNTVTGSTRADAPQLCLGGLLADVRTFFYNTAITLP